MCKFTVGDNGIGMTTDVIDHVFEMFAQAKRTSDRTQGGLGIGLALVKNLIQMHGGKVMACSAGPGLGSQFHISFSRNFDTQEIDSNRSFPTRALSSSLTLLVVDDNVDAAMMLGLCLEKGG